MKLSKAVRDAFKAVGAKGGKARAKRMSKPERSEAARHAAQARWGKAKEATS